MFTDDHVNFNATQWKDRPVSNFTFRHLKAFQSRPTHVLQHKGQLLVSDAVSSNPAQNLYGNMTAVRRETTWFGD
jgi:hypothetical protein